MYRLIYKSRSACEIDWALVRDILHVSEINNKRTDVTGFLLATETRFLQVLEGRFDEINETFLRIARDQRHDEICLISYGVVEERLFGDWNMRGIGVFDLNADVKGKLVKKYGEEQGGINLPRQEWRALSMISDIGMLQDPSISSE